jgi:hypothetical protein
VRVFVCVFVCVCVCACVCARVHARAPSVWNLLHATFLANRVLRRLVNFWEIYAPLWLYRTFEWYISADAMKHSVSGEADSRSDTLETLHLILNL